jgi:hypothetical protein
MQNTDGRESFPAMHGTSSKRSRDVIRYVPLAASTVRCCIHAQEGF